MAESENIICPHCGKPLDTAQLAGDWLGNLLQQGLTPDAEDTLPSISSGQPEPFGGYELVREVARTNASVVYKARQTEPARRVALKIIRAGALAGETDLARFRTEAHAAARLNHPNIVPIYALGEHDGQPFITTAWIDGGDLGKRLNEFSVPSFHDGQPVDRGQVRRRQRVAARLLATAAWAIHHAHQRRIIHRDLKPSNILLSARGEPHITDFGLAKDLDSDSKLTLTGVIMGTPAYMAPEQVNHHGDLTTAVDVYSMGAILYHLLTGRPPFESNTPVETLRLVVETDPKPPRTIHPLLDRDLETICLKCLEKVPERRYESAAALADELDRWLRGEPIEARPASLWTRTWKWTRRNPWKTAAVALAILALFSPLATSLYYFYVQIPQAVRTHPTEGFADDGTALVRLNMRHAPRATMNFDLVALQPEDNRRLRMLFTNIPPEHLAWVSTFECQVWADVPAGPDPPRSPVFLPGQEFTVEKARYRDRAYYIAGLNWTADELHTRAPQARVVLIIQDHPRP